MLILEENQPLATRMIMKAMVVTGLVTVHHLIAAVQITAGARKKMTVMKRMMMMIVMKKVMIVTTLVALVRLMNLQSVCQKQKFRL